MKTWMSALVVCACVASTASATPRLDFERTTHPGGVATAIFLDVGDANGTFNTFDVQITPETGEFLNFDSDGATETSLLTAGDDASFTNALLPAPPVIGGQGLTLIGHLDDTASEIRYAAALIGQFFDFSEPIFLNNLFLPPGVAAEATVWLINSEGEIFDTLTTRRVILHPNDPFPEPTAITLAGVALTGALLLRLRNV